MFGALQSWWSSAWPQATALLVALLAAWIVFRLQRREKREGVLSALIAELQMHEAWVGNNRYPKDSWANTAAKWWGGMQPGKVDNVVYKLSTVAIDSAIQGGPSLFINRALLRSLVNYRLRANLHPTGTRLEFRETSVERCWGATADSNQLPPGCPVFR